MHICIYFQVHQPLRLANFSITKDYDEDMESYFDSQLNRRIMEKVAQKCYLPANRLMLELLEKNPGFKVSYSLTGVFIEQCKMFAPEVMQTFAELAKTGRAEFLSETYYHSLSCLFEDKEEFISQIELHSKAISEFASPSKVFRNTEAMFSNEIAYLAERLGYKGILAEGLDHILGWRSPNYLYTVSGCESIKALLRHYRLSDDVGYRFSAKWWSEYPLTAEKYARWLSELQGDCVNIFMDYETFGEHHWEDTGIFEFLRHLPQEVQKHRHLAFSTPSEIVDKAPARGEIDVPHTTSWADMERDTSAWLGNDMQKSSFAFLESLGKKVKQTGDKDIIRVWRMLQNSDHFYYMCTKSLSDQDVHNYFSPYDSPFDAYINYMNILQDFAKKVEQRL
ncbi:MAG: glycoside hydrolase family 57 protein [Candidatus Micrarchaeota archaeon]|nr:glycoside hydrolase family 57 protein [Candidatus Micrarchaeota archaeon]